MQVGDSREPHERGQSLVEFALMLPVLLLILMGTLDLGRLYASYVTVTNAAREGAGYGANHPSDSNGVKTRAFQEASGSGINLLTSNMIVTCSPDAVAAYTVANCSAPVVGGGIRVQVEYDFTFVSPFLFDIGSLPVSNTATMTIITLSS